TIPNAATAFDDLLARISHVEQHQPPVPIRTSAHVIADLQSQLAGLTILEPQPRGYAFEKFLKDLLDTYALAGRASFRLVGEQIDGSFELAGATYLLEAKWKKELADAADLRAFNGKVEDKAAWSRGLFISDSGFSEDGLSAFGRGKRVVCMDGLDLREMLNRGLPFPVVVQWKVRRAAEAGQAFANVSDLFP